MLTYVKAHSIWYRSQADVSGQIRLGVLSFIVPWLEEPSLHWTLTGFDL